MDQDTSSRVGDEKLPAEKETNECDEAMQKNGENGAEEGAKNDNETAAQPPVAAAEPPADNQTTDQRVQERPDDAGGEDRTERLSPEASSRDEVDEAAGKKLNEEVARSSEVLKNDDVKCPETSLIEFKGGGAEEIPGVDDQQRSSCEDRLPHSTTNLRGSESPIPVGNLPPPPRSRRPQLLDNLKKKTTSESSEPESLEDEDSPPPSVAPAVQDGSVGGREEPDNTSGYINKRSSLYVKNPDFTKRMQQPAATSPAPQVSTIRNHAAVSNDLSTLRMKPPDFSKVTASVQPPTNVTPSNFEEISRRYNYISDLQLKPQSASTAPVAGSSYRNLYVSAPTFTSHKFHGEPSERKPPELEEPTAHIIHKKPQYLPPGPLHEVANYPEAMVRSYSHTKNQYLPPRTDQRAPAAAAAAYAPPSPVKAYPSSYGGPPGPHDRAKKYDPKPRSPPKVATYEPKASVIQQQQQVGGYSEHQHQPKVATDLYGQRAYSMMPPQMARSPVVIKHPPSPSGSMNPPQNWPGRVGTPQSPHNGSTHSPNFLPPPAPVAYKPSQSPTTSSYYPNGEMKSPYGAYYAPKMAAKDKPPIDYVDLTKPQKGDAEAYRSDIHLRGSPRSESLGRNQPREPVVYEMRHSSSENNLSNYYRQHHQQQQQQLKDSPGGALPKDPMGGYIPYPTGSSSSKQQLQQQQSVPYRYPPHVKESPSPKAYRYAPSPQEAGGVYERNSSVIERLPPSVPPLPAAAAASAAYEASQPAKRKEAEVPPKAAPVVATATTNSVFAPVKRESPLDLSVKTVKTKADSTGCDDNAIGSSSSKGREASHSLKVNYVPNFSKHTQQDEYRYAYEAPPRPQPIPPNAGQVLAKRVAVPERDVRGYAKPAATFYPPQQQVMPRREEAPVAVQRNEYSPSAGMYYDPKNVSQRQESQRQERTAAAAYYARESVVQPPNATNVIKSVKQEVYQYQQYPPKGVAQPEVRSSRYENHIGYQKYPQAIPPAEYAQAYAKSHMEAAAAASARAPPAEAYGPHGYGYSPSKVVAEKEERKRPPEAYQYEMAPPKKSPKMETPIQQKVETYLNNAGYYKSHHYPHPPTPPQHHPHHPNHPTHPTHPSQYAQHHQLQHPAHPTHPTHPTHSPQSHHPAHPSHHQAAHPQHHQAPPHLAYGVPTQGREPLPRPVAQNPYQYRPGEYPYAPKEVKTVQEKTAEPSVAVYYPQTPKKDPHPATFTPDASLRYTAQQNFRAAMPYDPQRAPAYAGSPPQPPQNPYEVHEKHTQQDFRQQQQHPPAAYQAEKCSPANTVTARQWYPSLPPQQNHQYQPPGVFHPRPPDPTPPANLIRTPSDERLVANGGKLGADREVISKLKTTIEGKQKMVRKQNSGELDEEEANKADIASLLAARIRTKGELKGFTPIPVTTPEGKDAPGSVEEEPTVPIPPPVAPPLPPTGPIDPPSDLEGTSAFDLLDFGSACNDFVEQLQTGKKKMKRRRSRKSEVSEVKLEVAPAEVKPTVAAVPPESIVPQEAIQKAAESLKDKTKDDTSSSDEDKPLFLLRQQSEEVKAKSKKATTSEDEDPATKRAEIFERLTDKITKRLAARLNTSTSEDEEASKSSQKRKRKPLRKTKMKNVKSSDEDSSAEEQEKMVKKKPEKSCSESEIVKKKLKKGQKSTDHEASGNEKKGKTPKKGIKQKNPPESSSDEDEEEEDTTKKGRGKKSGKNQPAKKRQSRKSLSTDGGSSDSGEDGDSEEKSTPKSKNSSAAKSTDGGKEKAADRTPPLSRTKSTRRSKDVGSGGGGATDDTMSMTRSKKRKEMEQRLANSKVLRNEKIVHNVVVDKKKKTSPKAAATLKVDEAKRKILDTDSEAENKGKMKKKPRRISKLQSSSSSESSESESEAETVSERLRPRKPQQKPMIPVTPSKNGKVSGGGKNDATSPGKKNNVVKQTAIEGATEPDLGDNKYPPGWELQLYEYKRSLKIPPSLITIARPSWHRISTSLPDLDPHSSDASESYRAKENERPVRKKGDPHPVREASAAADDASKSSIIDLLHQRVTQRAARQTAKKSPRPVAKTVATVKTSTPSVAQLLATPGVEDDDRSIFGEAKLNTVLKSRTRTEYRMMKNKELIRQVFGGEDRPASAPPFRGGVDCAPEQMTIKQEPLDEAPTMKPVTFDQKFQEYIQQIDRMSIEEGFGRDTTNAVCVKTEKDFGEDTETQDTVLESQSVNSEREGLTPISFTNVIRKTKKGARSVRRKGSSGFDYIRKKKKPLTESQQAALAKKRMAVVTELRERDEQDIGREVKAWVLNKGVGESVLHKAARLNYLDVIAYCLDRMEMFPDQKDNAGYTPLHEACSRGHLQIARLLLEYGANVSETAQSGIRPLHDAVENGYVEVARLLLSYGADPLLATYAGQTPLQLAEDDGMALFLKNHLYDVQHNGPDKSSWKFAGPWEIYDPDIWGFSILSDVPEPDPPAAKEPEKCDSNSNIMKKIPGGGGGAVENGCSNASSVSGTEADASDGELFEMEESDMPLPPLYLLRDEGADKWVLLSDLCNLLKVKSRDTLLKQIHPGGLPAGHKDLVRELRTGDFLQKATCLQLLCAGEKLNIRSSKVVLIKYNESVQALLGVQTLLMRL
ncbi:nascent polypeptide-associated complex subunit alpha, muscle-specific form [Lutzomyia longipalpis]|uniref:nascent polypeptide-associated complex subunit alpha, muscle-specific form n=1 Tax=Lutzomyia longipalpis TaxID=7200 RepID=UPI002483F211|nr:nascent polypeptide-associated complex subunit alpha, muscle-specific form [Lutzomyia longipalpis]XP_055689774.1 nascent polypeptide-associated complex subunit alpha, muscle-specific form [Lutzomyia longipalpis]